MKVFNAQFKDERYSTSNVSTATSCHSESFLRRWGKIVLCLFTRILFNIRTVVIVLTRPAYSTVTHWNSNSSYSAKLRRLKRPDNEDGYSEVLAEKKTGVFQLVLFYSPNLIRYEYDNILTEVSAIYGFSDRASGVAPVNILQSHPNVSKVCQ